MLNLKKNLNFFIFGFINIIFVLLRVPDFYRPLWSDEIISLRTTFENPLINPLYDGVSTNLPLYYYLIKIFSFFFSGENLRISSLLVSIIILNIFLYRYLKEKDITFLLASFFITFSPIQIYYANELRTYMLTELLLVIQFFFLKDYLERRKVNFYFWGLSIFLSLISHYTAYIFVFSTFVYLVFKENIFKERKLPESLLKAFVIPGILSLIILVSISGNYGFTDSTDNSVLSLNFSRFSYFNIKENILRLVEVLTIYYNYGLHYYRLDGAFTSFFKKFMYFFILVPLFWVIIKEKFKNFQLNLVLTLISSCLLLAVVFDLSGFLIFAGRYIFPFHFLYILLFSIVLKEIYYLNKWIFGVILGIFFVSYNLYNSCLYLQLDIYRGNNDPQGMIIQSCFK